MWMWPWIISAFTGTLAAAKDAQLPPLPLPDTQLNSYVDVSDGPDGANGAFNSPDDLESTDVAFCTVNAMAAFFYLSQAGVELAGATEDCTSAHVAAHGDGSDAEICCAADVWGVLQSFVNTGALISGLVTQCGTAANLPADCASVVMAFTGSIFEALEAGLSAHGDCKLASDVLSHARLLLKKDGPATAMEAAESSQDAHEPVAPRVRGLDAGWCFVNVGSAGAYLAQMGVIIDIAVGSACRNQTTQDNRANCAASVTAMVAAMANGVSYLASAAQRCGGSVTMGVCAGDVGSMVNAFSGVASASSSFLLTCSKVIAEGNEYIGKLKEQTPLQMLNSSDTLKEV